MENNIVKISDQLKQIDLSAKDSLSAYGKQMPVLIKRIKELTRAKKFTKEPRGPIGQYIEISNKRYRNIVENTIGHLIHNFYVNSDRDRVVITDLLKKEFPELVQRTAIVTGQFHERVFDTNQNRVRPPRNTQCQCFMDLINVTDPIVMNCLIDQRAIESILVVEDTDLAIQLTSEQDNVPKNLSRVLLPRPFSK